MRASEYLKAIVILPIFFLGLALFVYGGLATLAAVLYLVVTGSVLAGLGLLVVGLTLAGLLVVGLQRLVDA